MKRCPRTRILLVVGLLATVSAGHVRAQIAGDTGAPSYSVAGIVQAAGQTGTLAPNAVVTIYGSNLSFSTHALTAADVSKGELPLSLDGVTVYVNGLAANLFYVSPGQVNFLVPYEITASTATIYVSRRGLAGPAVKVPIATTAPAFFSWNGNFAVAQHADGTLITPVAAAKGGEVIVLFAAGMGRTSPDISSGYVAQRATWIYYLSQLQIQLNGAVLPAANVLYAGLTPGFAGLYQINVRLPDVLPADPEIRIAIGQQSSPAGIRLYSVTLPGSQQPGSE